ncbi:hypothetical protein M6D93_16200 [Jatrophihabitans telluris]|uniref:Uncharacterized protein n=1 Tax=Jatrophihabitans telluris TaxID=2038343 RepID=A0ABY4QWB9_9ACTN|nr:hypothetical protein [Jatrophihabitans telluris]UQX87830.1 hypothetical protein M6D93_16200 [Jatrophihabitans telluris]
MSDKIVPEDAGYAGLSGYAAALAALTDAVDSALSVAHARASTRSALAYLRQVEEQLRRLSLVQARTIGFLTTAGAAAERGYRREPHRGAASARRVRGSRQTTPRCRAAP